MRAMLTSTNTRLAVNRSDVRSQHSFTVDEYERMTEVGILTKDDRVELLEGVIVDKMTHKPPHNVSVDLTRAALDEHLPEDWRLREQKAIRLLGSEPEPDLAVVRGPIRRYATRHPVAKDIGMLVEVSDTSLREDRGRKQRIYARARIPIYWIINLVEAQVEVYSDPKGGRKPGYQTCQVYRINDTIPVILDSKQIGLVRVKDLMPDQGDAH